MSKYNRIKLELTDLSPQSVCKVFQFLEDVLENQLLDFEFFKAQIGNFTIGEQYFIFKYGKDYFSNENDSYLNRWLKNQDVVDDIKGDNKFFDLICNNCHKILNYIENNEKTVKRRFALNKKYNIEFDYLTSFTIPYRVPLYFEYRKGNEVINKHNLKDFKQKSFAILKEIMSERQFEAFFFNCFIFNNNIMSVELLNIEIDDYGLVYSKIYDLYKLYCDDRKQTLQEYAEYHNAILKKLPENRREFYKKKEFEKVGRIEFMKAMYNCFAQVRDAYLKSKIKKPSLELETYLLTQSRNIKK